MNLSGLLPLLGSSIEYQELLRRLKHEGGGEAVVQDAAKPYFLGGLYRDLGQPLLIAVSGVEKARQLHQELLCWLGEAAPVMLFSQPEALLYERLSPDPVTVRERLRVLHSLSSRDAVAPIVVASASAIALETIPYDDFWAACHVVGVGMEVNRDQLVSRWLKLGYEMDKTVEIPGTMSRRGGILDIYPPSSELPARIELFGDQVESIRLFDPVTQRSARGVKSVAVTPAREMLIPDNIRLHDLLGSLDLSRCSDESQRRISEELSNLLERKPFFGMELYASLFNHGSVLDYLPQDSVLVMDEPNLIEAELENLERQSRELRELQVGRGELPLNFPTPHFSWAELKPRLDSMGRRLALSQWGISSQLPFFTPPAYGGRLDVWLNDLRALLEENKRLIVISQQASRLSELLREKDIFAAPVSNLAELPPEGSLALVQGSLSGGWLSAQLGAAVITDAEIFGFVKERRLPRKRPLRREEFLSEIGVGDYLVHVEHGIARFAGLITMSVEGGVRDYLTLEYADGDRLYVPTDQVDRVSRYVGPGGHAPALSRLGSPEWSKAKQRVKEAAGKLARELLDVYSARELLPGVAFSPDTVWQQEMEAAFPYVETPDQMTAVREVKDDMEKPKPMDRLVCGDVGYGKTEVALRAAFKAVMDNKQAAFLVPTTVLAQQHYRTFKERIGAFPMTVEALSRLRTKAERQNVIEGLKKGTVDICIGTHRLLQKDVAFKDLGLVIIDEEQRFGVAHKERLKAMRKEVDVLTLTATPIPRTLHMSLIGIRDMSTMETPPEERLPIKTYVAEYQERLVRQAILRELDRGGQVFFVHNRVQTISWVVEKLREIVPEARIAIGHGQMPEKDLESVMLDFAQGKSDVLVCTTIIESGLDMPNVNTIIVNDAHKLGLTQLYQLRGRVGRGANRAYAYFLYPRGKRLTEAARQRLKTIFEATELGAGFRIALKDLEIRGAGNILGSEQSGHIGAVGFDLYSRLLSEAVEELKSRGMPRKTIPPPPVTIDLPLSARLPEDYVSDVGTRIAVYQRLVAAQSPVEVESIAQELRDRFGEMPALAQNLLYIGRLRCLAVIGGVQSVTMEEAEVVVRIRQGVRMDRVALRGLPGEGMKVGMTQVRLDARRLGAGWQRRLEEILGAWAKSKQTAFAASH